MLDVQMPRRSGLQFCRELKSNSLTELIPVIMITSMADAKHRIKGIEAGADDFLNKPFIADELRAVIKSQLRRKLAVDRRLISIQKSAPDHEFDAFISHASEDKDEFVRPLTQSLTSLGVRIWYDEHQLQVGDSLRDAIERGLALSSYGIVVLSPKFFEKRWPQRELSGLTARENNGKKVILPVWFNLEFEDVEKVAPMLADRIAACSQDGIDAVVQRLIRVIRPDLVSQSTE
jgi:CheY-like chemotaxis protein